MPCTGKLGGMEIGARVLGNWEAGKHGSEETGARVQGNLEAGILGGCVLGNWYSCIAELVIKDDVYCGQGIMA